MGSVLEAWEACSKIDTVFILVCCVFCWPIIPAVGLGYSGYSTRRSGLASFYPGLIAVIVCSIQWWIIGYSLAYGEGNPIIGGFEKAFHRGVLAEPVGTIPEILFSEFQLIFCATVCAIAVGGACERGRLLPLFPFCFVSHHSVPCLYWILPICTTTMAHLLTGFYNSYGALSCTSHSRTWSGPKQGF